MLSIIYVMIVGLFRQEPFILGTLKMATFCFSFSFFYFILFNFTIFFLTLKYCISFAIYQNESATGIHVFPS